MYRERERERADSVTSSVSSISSSETIEWDPDQLPDGVRGLQSVGTEAEQEASRESARHIRELQRNPNPPIRPWHPDLVPDGVRGEQEVPVAERNRLRGHAQGIRARQRVENGSAIDTRDAIRQDAYERTELARVLTAHNQAMHGGGTSVPEPPPRLVRQVQGTPVDFSRMSVVQTPSDGGRRAVDVGRGATITRYVPPRGIAPHY